MAIPFEQTLFSFRARVNAWVNTWYIFSCGKQVRWRCWVISFSIILSPLPQIKVGGRTVIIVVRMIVISSVSQNFGTVGCRTQVCKQYYILREKHENLILKAFDYKCINAHAIYLWPTNSFYTELEVVSQLARKENAKLQSYGI